MLESRAGQRESLTKEPNNPDTIHTELDHGQRALELNGFGCNWIRGVWIIEAWDGRYDTIDQTFHWAAQTISWLCEKTDTPFHADPCVIVFRL